MCVQCMFNICWALETKGWSMQGGLLLVCRTVVFFDVYSMALGFVV